MPALFDFLTGDRSEFVLDGLELQLRTMLVHAGKDVSPIHALGFKTPYQFRIAWRNLWLRRAAQAIGGPPGKRSAVLLERIRRFEARRYPRIKQMRQAGEGANAVDQALFECLDAGAEFPTSERQLARIIGTSKG